MSKMRVQSKAERWPAESGENDSGWAHQSENERSTDANTGRNPKAGKGILRKVGRATAKVTAADVLLRDGKRIRSRFPNLWKDILSGRWRNNGNAGDPVSKPKLIWVTPIITGAITIILALYTAILVVSRDPSSAIGAWSILACGAVTFAGFFQTSCFAYAAWLQRRRIRKGRS
ncbi:hypothetical protein [Marinobacter sp. tcs-11]|uniref:hypothetical protein n=1 Tax=Marinobacter sp. tcs-11 TaxID=1742860 RepID=UPI002580370D|nr:hypothetical protein [Marinobacter sp. tcs-11]